MCYAEKVPVDKLRQAYNCMLDRVNATDMYSTVVTAYTASLLHTQPDKVYRGREGKAAELVDSLVERANSSDTGDRFWDNERKISRWGWSYTNSEAVEMTAYMVMTEVLRGKRDNALLSVKWLARWCVVILNLARLPKSITFPKIN